MYRIRRVEHSRAVISPFSRLHDLLLNESGLERLEGKRVTYNARLHSGRVQRSNIPGGHEHLYRIKSDELPSGRTRETIPSNLTCKRVWSHGYVTGLIAFRIKPKCLAYLEREWYDPLNVSRGSRVLRYSLLLPLSLPLCSLPIVWP